MYIEQINGPEDVKKLNIEEMTAMAAEMRQALLVRASKHGGHFGPNFGMVEATIAMHYVFESPKDKIVYDVSHQSYPHKMLTGRKDAYLYEEHYDDVSGYSNPNESVHDHFTVGHTSTSVSLACGLAKARDLKKEDSNVIAVIGDGSLSGGEALEGLDYAAELGGNLIIVVNDNDMSIAENHGGLYQNLKLLRETNGQAECNLFRAMGLDYVYVDKGNDIAALIAAFESVKDSKKPVVVHIKTLKGKGYAPAEQNKEQWHWCMPFDRETGKPTISFGDGEDYTSITAEYIMQKAKSDSEFLVITPAMPGSAGLNQEQRKELGLQYVDVGIAEEQAVAMASGAAKNGAKPLVVTNTTFIQRAYDQISHDVCINNSSVTILLNYNSFDSLTDVTHLGIFGLAAYTNVPNLVVLAPTSKDEYLAMLDWAVDQKEHPVMILIPGNQVTYREADKDFNRLNHFKVEEAGEKVAILALGDFYQRGEQLSAKIKAELGFTPTLINPRFASGIDKELLESLSERHQMVITMEDGILSGGFGEKIASFYGSSDMKVKNYGLDKKFYDRYDPNELLKEVGMTPVQIIADICNQTK